MTKEEFKKIMPSIPHAPGCYKYFSQTNELLYVGKAKDLRKRVSSYFNKNKNSGKTRRLVHHIHHIDFTVTDSEHDAFLLENSLIKHFQPKYNISLKDDKTYPWIVIKNEPFPRVFLTRRKIKDGSEYIGPFTSVTSANELLALIKQTIPLRTCRLNLAKKHIDSGKYKVCLEYHLGNCLGPCEGLQSEANYQDNLKKIKHILKGNLSVVLQALKDEMQDAVAKLNFEKAQMIKQKILLLQNYHNKSNLANLAVDAVDVVSILSDEKFVVVNFMMVSDGNIIHSRSVEVKKQMNESHQEILEIIVANLRDTYNSRSKEIVAPIEFLLTEAQVKLTIPKAGEKKKLLELSEKNARIFLLELNRKENLAQLGNPIPNEEILTELKKVLSLKYLPVHIECFDNSNFQGAYPVAAMVCFKNGQPSKKDYRRFKIKTVEGINDFASMEEIVFRRYKRLTEEEKSLPQLVIIDGGKGQLSAAIKALEKLRLQNQMTVVGLAKKEESIFFPKDSDPIQLPYDSEAHKLIRRIRDEVHRFAITFHRELRSKGTIKNELETIPGIGENTAALLLKTFKSVAKIKRMTQRELTAVIGQSKARKVFEYFKSEG